MSDAMTSREIEDVLSSVRRLVSQESHRTAAPAPPARLILTEAHRVQPDAPARPAASAPAISEAAVPPPMAPAMAPPVDNPPATEPGASLTPRKELEETIAELEAAVSAMGETWESETGDPGPSLERPTAEAANVTAFSRKPLTETVTTPVEAAPDMAEAAPDPGPESTPEGEAEGLEAVLDEDMLRQLVAYLVREELQGQLGERVTFQVRKLVRSEIAKVLDERGLI